MFYSELKYESIWSSSYLILIGKAGVIVPFYYSPAVLFIPSDNITLEQVITIYFHIFMRVTVHVFVTYFS